MLSVSNAAIIIGSQDSKSNKRAPSNKTDVGIAAFRGDVLIIESEQDVVVPHPVAESYAVACARARSVTARVIAHADHGLSEKRWRSEYVSFLTGWLAQIIPSDQS